jgi:hypothetical protein
MVLHAGLIRIRGLCRGVVHGRTKHVATGRPITSSEAIDCGVRRRRETMSRSDSEERPRLVLFLVFAGISGLLLYNSIRSWETIDTGEKWARAAELLLIAVGAWAVVWPESFPPWRWSKRGNSLKEAARHPEERSAGPNTAPDRGGM